MVHVDIVQVGPHLGPHCKNLCTALTFGLTLPFPTLERARPCSNTYAVCNALAGHYNSFGTKAPLPKKRLERLNKVWLSGALSRARWARAV